MQHQQQQRRAARAAPQHGCVGNLANRYKMRTSGSDSYALLFLIVQLIDTVTFIVILVLHA